VQIESVVLIPPPAVLTLAQAAVSPHSFWSELLSHPLEQKPPGKVTVGTGPPPMVVKHSEPGTTVHSAFVEQGSPMSPPAVAPPAEALPEPPAPPAAVPPALLLAPLPEAAPEPPPEPLLALQAASGRIRNATTLARRAEPVVGTMSRNVMDIEMDDSPRVASGH